MERKYLWNNNIFNTVGNTFNDLIKKYLGKFTFSLEVRHSVEFYDLIGEEEKQFLMEEKNTFTGNDIKEANTLLNKNPPKTRPKVLGMGSKKPIIKGKMKK